MHGGTTLSRVSRRLLYEQTWLRLEECIMGLDDDFTSPKNLLHSTSVAIQTVKRRVSTMKGLFPFQITHNN